MVTCFCMLTRIFQRFTLHISYTFVYQWESHQNIFVYQSIVRNPGKYNAYFRPVMYEVYV